MAKKNLLQEGVNAQNLKVKLFALFTLVKKRVKGNWGIPFIAGFLFILVFSAVSRAAGASSLAESLASFGYYVFAIGIVVQTACFLKLKKEVDSETDN